MQIVTFDFHNTLVSCDRWFELEVRTLPWDVILELNISPSERPDSSTVLSAYRQLRAEVVRSGNEINSYTSVERIFTTLDVTATQADVRASVDHLMADALDSARLEPGAGELVRDLHKRGARLAVISSAIHHDFLQCALQRFSLTECFEGIVTSASSGYYKSNPEIYRSTLAELGGYPASCVHIGDSLRWDVGSAQKVGVKTVWLDRDGDVRPWDDAPLPVPDLRLKSLAGASGVILNLLESVSPSRE
ncbi:MAG: hypothetical protein AVDCRST_MAG43-1664 [uncultured Thermomicrobiales bacterium]|uniref:HAD family hydrolase n=1 Tax=uncultured Thermomicrobiales bacterium TaxID=1645740 RepID=A0A6J4URH2_9BACT|nr:MAG: hypothetical protein AVDCRST_MAG43-1664 [uncultured Thermomicrobiales bacterium]